MYEKQTVANSALRLAYHAASPGPLVGIAVGSRVTSARLAASATTWSCWNHAGIDARVAGPIALGSLLNGARLTFELHLNPPVPWYAAAISLVIEVSSDRCATGSACGARPAGSCRSMNCTMASCVVRWLVHSTVVGVDQAWLGIPFTVEGTALPALNARACR